MQSAEEGPKHEAIPEANYRRTRHLGQQRYHRPEELATQKYAETPVKNFTSRCADVAAPRTV
jgi:hypothetical protein